MKKHTVFGLGLMLACGAVMPARAADVDEVIKKISEKFNERKSGQMKMKVKMDATFGTNKAKNEGEGTYEFLRKGDKLLFRKEQKIQMLMNANGREIKLQQTKTLICDGDFKYDSNATSLSKPRVTKHLVDPADNSLAKQFEALRKNNELKLLPEAKVDGTDCYVIEAAQRAPSPTAPTTRTVMYYGKDSGVLLKLVTQTSKGEDVETTTYFDVKLDQPIDPERFVFKAPEGVTVQDMTSKGKPGPTSGPALP